MARAQTSNKAAPSARGRVQEEDEAPRTRRARAVDPEPEEVEEEEVEEEEERPRGRAAPQQTARPAPATRGTREEASVDSDDVINWSDVDEEAMGEYEVLPRGTYECVVDDTKFALSKEKKSPMLNLTLEVVGGDFDKRKLWHRIVLTPKTLGMVKAQLRVLGVEFPKKAQTWAQAAKWLNTIADGGTLIGAECNATVKIREYEGEKRNEVRSIKTAGATDERARGDKDFME